MRKALGASFLDSDSEYEKYTSDSDDGSANISDKSCGENMHRTCRTRISPLEGWNVLRAKKASNKKSLSLFPLQKKTVTWIQTTESRRETFAEIFQRMFSEIMFAFIKVAEMKTKIAKSALYKCSRGVLLFVDKIENWKNT